MKTGENVSKMEILLCNRVENIVGKSENDGYQHFGENAGYQHFLHFPQCFLPY